MFKELNELKEFLEKPNKKIHVRGYAKCIKVTPATASKILKIFAEKNILEREEIQNIHFYKLKNNQLTRDLKIFYNIQKIRQIIPQLNEFFGKPTIVLFGSTSKGEDVEESDIDIYIKSEITKTQNTQELEKIIGKTLQLFIYKKITAIPNKHLQHNILNGIVLQGEITWK